MNTEQSEDFVEEVETTEEPQAEEQQEGLEAESEAPEGEEEEQQQQSRSQNAKQRLRRKLREEQSARFEAEERARQLAEQISTIEAKVESVINPPPARPNRVDFDTEEEYEDSLFEWRDHSRASSPVREPVTAVPAQAQAREVASPVDPEVRKNWDSQVEDAYDKYDDFDEKIASIPKESMTDPMTFAIMESDAGGEIAYFLGENHAEAERIARLPMTAQVREIDKLSNKFKPTTTRAPEPIKPTRGGDTGSNIDPAKMSPEQYRDYRRKQGMHF